MANQTLPRTYRFYPEDLARLDIICKECGVSQTEAVRLAIYQFDPSPKGVGRAVEASQEWRTSSGIKTVRPYPLTRVGGAKPKKEPAAEAPAPSAPIIDLDAPVSSEWEKLSW